MPRSQRAYRLVELACIVGLIHAAFSLYWALGGDWLLQTVGKWATDLAAQRPQLAFWGLLLIALVKATAAIVPLLGARGQMPWPRLWRGLSWMGGVFLMLYGGVNMVVAWGVLYGIISSAEIDRASMQGHAALWDPLFFLWGAALTGHLWLSRRATT